jgi:cell division protein FtsI (penicillin-binding protein 3)
VLIQTDAKRHAFSRVERPSTTGADLELTIDQYLQHIAERELQAGVDYAGAEGGSAVVMDPATGEILALASYPTFNPNAYRNFRDETRRNRAIQDLYEPGSTFKIVTASAALEQKLVKPNDWIDTNPGVIRFGARVIDEDKHHNYGVLTFTDVLVRSSNVGAIKIGLRVGAERLGLYARRFGFGRPTSPDFPSESPGILWDPARQTDSALASMSMGYQVGVTPLQMASAVSSVANGGELVQPRVIRAVIRDGVRKPVPRKVLGRTIDAATAAEVTSIMEAVTERGTGKPAQIDGYTGCGQDGNGAESRERTLLQYRLQRVVCWIRSFAQARLHDCCRHRFATQSAAVWGDGRGADLPAHRSRRIASVRRSAIFESGSSSARRSPRGGRCARAADINRGVRSEHRHAGGW